MARRTETLYEPRRAVRRNEQDAKEKTVIGRRGSARSESYRYTEDVKVDATTPRNDLETSFAPFLLLRSTISATRAVPRFASRS